MKNSEIIMTKVASELLKLTVVVLLAVGAWNFSRWVGNHPVVPEYSANLTADQEKLKERFLNDTESPGVLTSLEKQVISEEVISSTKIFGIDVTGIKYRNLTFALELCSLVAFLFFCIGHALAVGIRKNEFTKFYFFITAGTIVVSSFMIHSIYGFELAKVIFLMFTANFIIGLANWPLWHLCDKFIDPNPEEKST